MSCMEYLGWDAGLGWLRCRGGFYAAAEIYLDIYTVFPRHLLPEHIHVHCNLQIDSLLVLANIVQHLLM